MRKPEGRKGLQIRGLTRSINSIRELIEEEPFHIPEERIFLGGHSQGCATAIILLLAGGTRLDGFIGLCGWLPFENETCAETIFEGSAPTNTLAIKLRYFFEFPWDPFLTEPALATRPQCCFLIPRTTRSCRSKMERSYAKSCVFWVCL